MKKIETFLLEELWEQSVQKIKEFCVNNLKNLKHSSPSQNSIQFYLGELKNNKSRVCIGFLKKYPNVIVLFFISKDKSENVFVIPFDKINTEYFFEAIQFFIKNEKDHAKIRELSKGNHCHIFRDYKYGIATEIKKEPIPVLILDIEEELKKL